MSSRAARWFALVVLFVIGLMIRPDAVGAVLPMAVDGDLGGDGSGSDGSSGLAPVLGGLVILGAVLAMGLAAIRRQRAEGRRSKLPPIG